MGTYSNLAKLKKPPAKGENTPPSGRRGAKAAGGKRGKAANQTKGSTVKDAAAKDRSAPVERKEGNDATRPPRHRATTTPRAHGTTVSRYQETTIEAVRKAVREFGKEAATHRFTAEEKKAIADLIYTYKNEGIRTSENEVARIAVNFIVGDYRENGKNSILDRVLRALNE